MSFDKRERPKESAFSPYSNCVSLDNLHCNCRIRNKGITRCSIDCIYQYTLSVERFRKPLYSFYRESSPTQEDRDINGWLHFLRSGILHRAVYKVVPDTNKGGKIMIATAKQDGSEVVVYNESGYEMFRRYGELVGFTGTTVSIKNGSDVVVYDDRGSEKFRR